jgi:hypothetical protein
VKEACDLVTAGARGAGVAEVVERLLTDDLCDVCRNPKRTSERPPEVVG